MYYARMHRLLPGDRLLEPIFQTGISKHHSIYLGVDQYGTEWIAENHKLWGVRLVKATDFFTPGKNFTVNHFQGSNFERETAVKRALSLMGKPYDLINYNCEHYASYVQTGNANSKQVLNVVAILLGILFIGLATAE